MSLKIELDDKFFDRAHRLFKTFEKKVLVTATRQAMNKALLAVRTKSVLAIKAQRRMKSSVIKNKFMKMHKARGSQLDGLGARLNISGRKPSLIRFIKGRPEPPKPKEKGIMIRKRKPIRVEVKPGRTAVLRKAFVIKGKNSNNIIVRRKTAGREPVVPQRIPALSNLFTKPKFRKPIEDHGGRQLLKEFDAAMKHQINKLKAS